MSATLGDAPSRLYPEPTELVELRERARQVADQIRPHNRRIDEQGEVPEDVWRIIAESGLLAVPVPSEFGGQGLWTRACTTILQELAQGSGSASAVVCGTLAASLYMRIAGTAEQQERYLPTLAKGGRAAWAGTEPETGSDFHGFRTKATWTPEGWRLNGRKWCISNAGVANVFVTFAQAERDGQNLGMTIFLIEPDNPGLTIQPPLRKTGLNGQLDNNLVYDDLLIGHNDVLGRVGGGFATALSFLDFGRMFSGANALGLAQEALNRSLARVRSREQFGHPLAEFQAVQLKIAETATQVELIRSLLHRVALAWDEHEPGTAPIRNECAMLKVQAVQTAISAATTAIELWGGHGYIKDNGVEIILRDALGWQFMEGAPDPLRLVVARQLLRERSA